MESKQFKIRCSAIGDIMANSRTKDPLSKGAKTYVKHWLKEKIYGYEKEWSNKYVAKGHEVEQDSLDFVAFHLNFLDLPKNEDRYENDYLTGTPDALPGDIVIDVKNSWDFTTFPIFENNVPTKDYMYQLQGYMALTGRKKAKLIYTLMDTPEFLLSPHDDIFTYENIDVKYRVKVFEIERDNEMIDKIYKKVEDCRAYINELQESL